MTRALVIACVLGAATAAADPTPIEQAKAHFKQGKAYQAVGEHAKAAEEYKAAYGIDPRPEMLFNIAQAYRLAGDKAAALDYFKQYLDVQPSGAGADEARGHVATLTKQIADEQAAQTAAQPQPPPPPPPPAPHEPEQVAVQGPHSLRIAGLAAAGAGIIAVGAGVKLGLDARDAESAIAGHDMAAWTLADEQTFEDGQRANRHMKYAYAGGAVLVTAGAVMYYLGARTHLVPVVSAQTAGVVLWGAL